MHLVLGDPLDPLCVDVRDVLVARGSDTRIIASPLLGPVRFAWRLDNDASVSRLVLEDGLELRGEDISGVFIGGIAPIDPRGWESADLMYMHSEVHAALLAWLSALECAVVNRFDASTWYRPNPPLLSWHGRLARAGLPTTDVVVTNVADEARAFARRGSSTGVDAAVFGPLTSDGRYLVSSAEDWRGLRSLQQKMPVALTRPHGGPQFACVVGARVVWEGAAMPEVRQFEPALRAFAADTGLSLVEVIFAPVSGRMSVIGVDPRPRLDHFSEAGRTLIVEAIADLLTEDARLALSERDSAAVG
ncbi:MAG: hypothetical protein ACJ77D_05075 [Chloroflexota bacterium]